MGKYPVDLEKLLIETFRGEIVDDYPCKGKKLNEITIERFTMSQPEKKKTSFKTDLDDRIYGAEEINNENRSKNNSEITQPRLFK